MNEFIKILLSLSVSGTLLLLFILGLKQIYKNKFSRRWQYYIWIIVVLRFLIPFTPDTMNVRSLLEMLNITVITNESTVRPNVSVEINTNDNEMEQLQIPPNENMIVNDTATQKLPNVYVYLFFTWSSLALVLFVRKITIYQGFIQYIKAGNTEVSDIKTLNLLSECEEKLDIKTRVELYRNAMITSPIMIGFFRPSIVLPFGELEDKELSYIFMHELRHYKQRDMFYKWLIQIVTCIHWFNPFVYLLEKEVNKTCELSCDEAVISILDDKTRREYGDTLIYFLKSNNLYKSSLASVTLTENAEQLKERLGVIMNFKEKSKITYFLMGILTLCIIFGAAFVGVYPVSAANHPASSEAGSPPISEEKNSKTGTYIYDENLDSGWYLDDEDWNDKDWDFDWDDEDWDWDDKALIESYAAFGIEKNGKSYYYQGELVNIIKDQRPDSSFYMLDINSKGTASIKVIRNTEGEITGVSYMTEEEIAELSEQAVGETEEIPAINTREWDSSSLSAIEIYIPNHVLDNVKVETVSGAITADDYAGVIALSTTSGGINIYDSDIAGNVNTVSGTIGLYPSDMLGNLYVNSHSGKISAILPASINYNIKAETATGKIKGNYFDTQSENEKEFSGIVGKDPKFTITLKTFSANIEVNQTLPRPASQFIKY